jgi:hypothetical protein
MSSAFFVTSSVSIVISPLLAALEAGSLSTSGPWRPPEWSGPALNSITVPSTSAPATTGISDGLTTLPGAPAYQGTPAMIYVFDCVPRVEHRRTLRKTRNPIQTSVSTPFSSICDHSFLEPAVVTFEIGMSDAMDSFIAGAWTSNASKSISAFEQLTLLQTQRTLFTLTTRLATYTNMCVEDIHAPDTNETRHGLKATVVFSETQVTTGTAVNSNVSYTASDETGTAVSARPDATDSTPLGTVQATPPSTGLLQQNYVGSVLTAVLPALPVVPGSGLWSSVNLGKLGALLAQ